MQKHILSFRAFRKQNKHQLNLRSDTKSHNPPEERLWVCVCLTHFRWLARGVQPPVRTDFVTLRTHNDFSTNLRVTHLFAAKKSVIISQKKCCTRKTAPFEENLFFCNTNCNKNSGLMCLFIGLNNLLCICMYKDPIYTVN